MRHREVEESSTTAGLPVSPSMGPALDMVDLEVEPGLVDKRVVFLCGVSLLLAGLAFLAAQILVRLIALITNMAFHHTFSLENASPADHHLGLWVIGVPIVGGLIVGVMARYGSKAIRGHGIPEAMEQVLTNQSRVPPRMTFLKPLSAAIAIGTGGPFGAEGPIIATGGALGSLAGQLLTTTAAERKTLLAAGAAAGMSATFGAPASAVLLAVELLLFEFRPRSMIPVALASAAAAGLRVAVEGAAPVFPMPDLHTPTGVAIACYILIGALVGVAAVGVTKLVYGVEDAFEKLPIHWMWWPAIGAVAVGVVGYFAPRTLGVGYSNITGIISNTAGPLKFVAFLCVMKLVSWSISLGSGTSGGTLAPLFTIGSGIGLLLGAAVAVAFPHAGIDIRIAALVGMAAIFSGASRAMLASAVFAFETTLQPLGLLPLVGGCAAAYLVSCLLMRHSIMTEKIARRGIRVPVEYAPDYLAHVRVASAMTAKIVTLRAADTVGQIRAWIESAAEGTSHQGFPLVNDNGDMVGIVTRRTFLSPNAAANHAAESLLIRPPVVIYSDSTLREAADRMVNHDIGRLPVIDRDTSRLVGIITRSDLLSAHRRRLTELRQARRGLELAELNPFRRAARRSEVGSGRAM